MDATVTVDYVAAGTCPASADFWNAFSSRAHAVKSERGDFSIVVRIEPAQQGFAGVLRIVRNDEQILARTIEDTSCSDVMTALAIAAAITIESSPPNPPPHVPPPPTLPPPMETRMWSVRAGADTIVTSFLSPSASLGASPYVEIEGPHGVRARIGPHVATSFTNEASGGTVNATSVLGRIELGVGRLTFLRTFSFRVGALAELGAMIAEGRGTTGETKTAGFVDVGALARLAWEPSFLRIEIGAGGVLVPTQPRFFFRREGLADVVAFQVPVGGAIAEIGLGIRLF